jgi:hypothetical protein
LAEYRTTVNVVDFGAGSDPKWLCLRSSFHLPTGEVFEALVWPNVDDGVDTTRAMAISAAPVLVTDQGTGDPTLGLMNECFMQPPY